MKARKIITILILLSGMVSLFAKEPEAREPKAKATRQIEGTIIDEKTGEALAGVLLTVKENGVKTYSDLDGKFRIENVEQGNYNIEVNYVSYKKVVLKDIDTSSDVKVKVELKTEAN